jgi:hypothetical protein
VSGAVWGTAGYNSDYWTGLKLLRATDCSTTTTTTTTTNRLKTSNTTASGTQ